MGACNLYVEPDIQQAPGESIVYTVDWPSRGLPADVTIISQTYTPAGATDYAISNTLIVENGTMTAFQLTGGIPDTIYGITNTIMLSDDQTMQATLLYNCVLQNVKQRSNCI